MRFAEAALELPRCEGLVTYLNPLELEAAPLLDGLGAAGRSFVAIRPFSGGKISAALWASGPPAGGLPPAGADRLRRALAALGVGPAEVAGFCVRLPLLHPAVSSVLVGVSTLEHARAVIDAAGAAAPDRARFFELVRALGGPVTRRRSGG
jgi:aryl-alcohol dehydrogenase-like predicted oxidoreductase